MNPTIDRTPWARAARAACDQRLGLGDVVGQRLLQQDVLAGGQRRLGDLGVEVAGQADVDEVDVGPLDDARQSVAVSSQPYAAPAAATCAASRPTRTVWRTGGTSGKKARTLRQALECALPMKE